MSIHSKNHPFRDYPTRILELWTEVSIQYPKSTRISVWLAQVFPPWNGGTPISPYLHLSLRWPSESKQRHTRGFFEGIPTDSGRSRRKIFTMNEGVSLCISIDRIISIRIFSTIINMFPMKSFAGISSFPWFVQVFCQSWPFCPSLTQPLALKGRGWLGCSSVLVSTQKWNLPAQISDGGEVNDLRVQKSGNHRNLIFKDSMVDFGVCEKRWMMFNFGWAEAAEVINFPKSELS